MLSPSGAPKGFVWSDAFGCWSCNPNRNRVQEQRRDQNFIDAAAESPEAVDDWLLSQTSRPSAAQQQKLDAACEAARPAIEANTEQWRLDQESRRRADD